jgi:hypothetical protein
MVHSDMQKGVLFLIHCSLTVFKHNLFLCPFQCIDLNTDLQVAVATHYHMLKRVEGCSRTALDSFVQPLSNQSLEWAVLLG